MKALSDSVPEESHVDSVLETFAVNEHEESPQFSEDIGLIEEPAARVSCKDPFWAVLFLLNVGVVVYLAVRNGGDILKDDFGKKNADWGDGYAMLVVCGATAGFAGSLCLLWFWAALRDAEAMVLRSFTLWAAVCAAASLSFLALGQLWLGFTSLFCCFCVLCLYASAVHCGMGFAAANLSAASQALKAHLGGCAAVMLVAMGLALAWSAVCLAAALGTLEAIRDSSSSSSGPLSGGAVFLFLVSFYWGGLVTSNVSHVAVSGAVASWWFRPCASQDSHALRGALLRSLTRSFGSVCGGSLLVAVLEATRSVLRAVRGQFRCVACCADCLLSCVEAWVRLVNRFAFVYVAVYGDSFGAAGERVNELFTRRGFWTTIMNDWILSRVFEVGMLGIALSSAAFAFGLSTLVFDIKGNNADVLAVFGLLIGWLLAAVVMGTLNSAVATVYVAFGEEPEALKRNHPETFDVLYSGWNQNYPMVTSYILLV